MASERACFPPTFPGNTTRGRSGHLLSLAIDHTGTPGRICPITFRVVGIQVEIEYAWAGIGGGAAEQSFTSCHFK